MSEPHFRIYSGESVTIQDGEMRGSCQELTCKGGEAGNV